MAEGPGRLDLLFLGSGNAFAPEGRAFSSVLVDGRLLFDCGPTVLQQLRRAGVPSDAIDAVFISHFHGDHFFGLPFLFLDAWHAGRSKDLTIVGPPGIEARSEQLMGLAYPSLPAKAPFQRRYQEVADAGDAAAAGAFFSAASVQHVPSLECFAYRVELGGRSLVYSGDTTLCSGLLSLVPDADVVVMECSCAGESVHLSAEGVAAVARQASPAAKLVLTHLDGHDHPLIDGLLQDGRLILASDLARFSF